MGFLKQFFSAVLSFFTSGKAEAAFKTVADLVPKAAPIVETIDKLAHNKTTQEIADAYQRYAVPITSEMLNTAADQRGYLLLDLATKVLARQFPGTATNILNSAVQLAVTAFKANR